jgi:transcriptional regulator with GAF, ATPase, and Fis domain
MRSSYFWHKAILISAAVVVLMYAVAVLVYVSSTPEIGFRCSFGPVVKKVADGQTHPNLGDTILQVGDYQFPPKGQPQFWAQVQLLRKLTAIRDAPPDTEEKNFVRAAPDGSKTIRVVYQSADESTANETWCRLERLPYAELIPSIAWFIVELGLFGIGAFVFWKRPRDRSAALFFLLCIVTLGAFMGGYHWTRIATQPVLVLFFMAIGVLMPAVSLHFYLEFPRPKPLLQDRPWLLGLIYGIPAVFLMVFMGIYFYLRAIRDEAAEITALPWAIFGNGIMIYLVIAVIYYVGCVAALFHSYRTAADPTERNQVKWIFLGAVLALVPIGYTLYLIVWELDEFGAGAGLWPMFVASFCFTVAFAISITRYRLMQLDQLMSSGMVYFLISFAAGLVYYVVVFLGMLLSGVIQAPSFAQALVFSVTALVFLLFLDVARSGFRRVLDRRFNRQKLQLDRTLHRLGEAIEQLVDPPTLARRLLQAAGELLNVSSGAVYLREGDPPLYRLAGCFGSSPPPLPELSSGCPLVEALRSRADLTVRPGLATDPAQRQLRLLGGTVAYALEHEKRLLAFLVLGPKNAGPYEQGDFDLLAAFAQLTSLALENAEGHRHIELLNRDLQTKVEKIAEQQHRILALQAQLTGRSVRGPAAVVRGQASVGEEDQEGDSANGDTRTASDANVVASAAGIIGSSFAIRQVLEMVRKAAASPSAVLIRGESGTGKELIARALHEMSPRAGKTYVKVHCASLAANLLESELFGHVKGAFTGAHRDKVGRFELADGGTIFLDEIGDISLDVQTKLLRVLQEKTFERVGSSEPLEVDVRVIAATHQDLDELMRDKRFREDLYFRLKVIPISVPPLRARREDIPELALHFLEVYARRCGKAVPRFDDDAIALLKSYPWPGNVRELENVIERTVVVTEGATITIADLPPELQEPVAEFVDPQPQWSVAGITSIGVRAERGERARHERDRLVRALAAADGNKAEAARALGLARSTLVSRLKKHGLS